MEKLAQHGAAKVIDVLLLVRKAVERLSFQDVLGEEQKLPSKAPMDFLPGH